MFGTHTIHRPRHRPHGTQVQRQHTTSPTCTNFGCHLGLCCVSCHSRAGAPGRGGAAAHLTLFPPHCTAVSSLSAVRARQPGSMNRAPRCAQPPPDATEESDPSRPPHPRGEGLRGARAFPLNGRAPEAHARRVSRARLSASLSVSVLPLPSSRAGSRLHTHAFDGMWLAPITSSLAKKVAARLRGTSHARSAPIRALTSKMHMVPSGRTL